MLLTKRYATPRTIARITGLIFWYRILFHIPKPIRVAMTVIITGMTQRIGSAFWPSKNIGVQMFAYKPLYEPLMYLYIWRDQIHLTLRHLCRTGENSTPCTEGVAWGAFDLLFCFSRYDVAILFLVISLPAQWQSSVDDGNGLSIGLAWNSGLVGFQISVSDWRYDPLFEYHFEIPSWYYYTKHHN